MARRVRRTTGFEGVLALDDVLTPDWIGGFAASHAAYGGVAVDAARWADQVNDLQSYVKSVSGAVPKN